MVSLKEVYALFLESSGVITDSRKPVLNKLFFALKGTHFDGNTYAQIALEKGATAAIVDNPEIANTYQNCHLVDDVLQTLQALANHHRRQFDIPVIALTGSNGKTTTKELIATVLNTTHRVLATKGNLNNHIGVPLTLLDLSEHHTHALIEMGANHLNEISFLCSITQPTHGLITNVGKAHLEGFGSEEGVLKGKSELYRFLENNNGSVFINEDDKKLMVELGNNQSIPYAPSKLVILNDQPTLKLLYNDIEIHSQLAGAYNKANISAAVCVGNFFGVSTEKCAVAIAAYTPNNHRSQVILKDNKTIILDAYNANPTSMYEAIRAFSARKGNKAVILGFMAELGMHEEKEHRTLVEFVEAKKMNSCYWVGKAYKHLVKSNWFETTKALAEHLKLNPIKADQILIKGSRSVKLETITNYL